MGKLITVCLIIVGLINFAPLIGILSAQKMESVYSVSIMGNDLAILMRHRALLFGVLGFFILYSAFNPIYQPAAMLMAGVSMIGFAILVLTTGGYNEALAKVLIMDYIGIFFLTAAVIMKYGVKTN